VAPGAIRTDGLVMHIGVTIDAAVLASKTPALDDMPGNLLPGADR